MENHLFCVAPWKAWSIPHPRFVWILSLMILHMHQPREWEKFITQIVRLTRESRAGTQATPKWLEWKERWVAFFWTAVVEGKSRLEILAYRPGFYGLNFSTSPKGYSARVLSSAYPGLGQKRGKRRGRAQKLSVVQHNKRSRTHYSTTCWQRNGQTCREFL